jgi:hypothetical protein
MKSIIKILTLGILLTITGLANNEYFEFDKIVENINHDISNKNSIVTKNIKLKILRNLPYAKRGYIFKSKELMDFYKTKKWYKANPNYKAKLADLTKDEQLWQKHILLQNEYSNQEFFKQLNEYTKKFIYIEKTINNSKPFENNKNKSLTIGDMQSIVVLILITIWLVTSIVIMMGDNIGIVKLTLIFIPAFTFIYFLWNSKKFFFLLLKPLEWLFKPITSFFNIIMELFLIRPFLWLWR